MALGDGAFWYAVNLLPFVGIGIAILYVGYVAYEARLARERLARAPAPAGPDPVEELARVNAKMAANLAESRRTLEAARETLRRGIKG